MRSRVRPTPQRRANLSIDGIAGILEGLPNSALLISSDEYILAVNELASEISGYAYEEILGRKLREIFPNLIGRGNSVVTIQSLPDHSVSTVQRLSRKRLKNEFHYPLIPLAEW